MKHDWTVDVNEAKLRLDVFLTERLPDVTRSHIAKLLKQGTGRVNGKPATVHAFLKPGDLVEFSDYIDANHKGPETAVPPLNIVAETPDYLVINKPVGVLVHADAKHEHFEVRPENR
jgi:23S rRNA pseudouridine1911/1915/1917 synthase